MRQITSILIILVLTSCSGEMTRLELLENELQIRLPENFETIENSTEGFVDFEINIKLKFDNNELRIITKQIEESRYFDWSNIQVLSKFPDKETIVKQDTTINGIWKNDKNGYYFEFYGDWSEPVSARLDTLEKTLKFTFVHL